MPNSKISGKNSFLVELILTYIILEEFCTICKSKGPDEGLYDLIGFSP